MNKDNESLIGVNPLDNDTDAKLRHQILTYHLSSILTDRERAKLLGLPEGCRIRENAKILAPENLVCGKNVWIGEGAILDAQGGLSIGDYTQIGLSTMIWSHSSHKQALKSQTCIDSSSIIYKPTKIGKNCFIAGPSVVAAGVTIGNRVIVSPLSFVDQDIPDNAIYGGNRPVKKLEKRLDKLDNLLQEILSELPSEKVKEIMMKLNN